MLKEKIYPINELEQAVVDMDNSFIVKLIAEGAELTRPDILATKEAFDLYYCVAVLLLESSPCLRKEGAVRRLEQLKAHPEMIDLVRDAAKPLPENTHPQSGELIEALKAGEFLDVGHLAISLGVTLKSAPLESFDCLADFPGFLIKEILGSTLDARLRAHLFLYWRTRAARRKDAEKIKHLFDYLQQVFDLKGDNPERSKYVLEAWEKIL
jgi:hypothetical protein